MQQKSIEIILFRQLITYISMPSFIADSDGKLIYCNEPAEKILGFKFSETGESPANTWQVLFTPKDKQGRSIAIEKLPLFISAKEYRLAHSTFYILNLEKEKKHIELFSIPILNHMETFVGSIAFFQEVNA